MHRAWCISWPHHQSVGDTSRHHGEKTSFWSVTVIADEDSCLQYGGSDDDVLVLL
jgi:hypothetical protein